MCIVSVIFALCFWVMFVNYNKDLYLQSIKERGEKVTTEIVRTGYESGVTIGHSFVVLIYEYIDENGVEYNGMCESRFNVLEDAEKHIGEKVEIYIDGKGKSILTDRKINPGSNVILAVIFIVLCCALK